MGGENKQESGGGRGVKEKQLGLATVSSPTSSQNGGLKEGNTVTSESTGQVVEVTAARSGMLDASTTPVNLDTPQEVVHESVMKEIPASYANKLSRTSLTKANLRKLDANVPNDADYDVKFHDIPLLAYTSDGLSLIATKIDTPMMLDSYMNFMCVESCSRSSYARTLIEVDACNGFSDNLVMDVPNLEGPGYTKETILVENEWEPPYKGKGGSSRADDEGFVDAKKNKLGERRMSQHQGNGIFSLSNSFGAFNVDDPANEQGKSSNMACTSGVQEEGKSATLLVEKINMFEKQTLEGKCVLVDDDGKPLEKG
nr:hypothetical protein [Tanacetum cinerariifolium]